MACGIDFIENCSPISEQCIMEDAMTTYKWEAIGNAKYVYNKQRVVSIVKFQCKNGSRHRTKKCRFNRKKVTSRSKPSRQYAIFFFQREAACHCHRKMTCQKRLVVKRKRQNVVPTISQWSVYTKVFGDRLRCLFTLFYGLLLQNSSKQFC